MIEVTEITAKDGGDEHEMVLVKTESGGRSYRYELSKSGEKVHLVERVEVHFYDDGSKKTDDSVDTKLTPAVEEAVEERGYEVVTE